MIFCDYIKKSQITLHNLEIQFVDASELGTFAAELKTETRATITAVEYKLSERLFSLFLIFKNYKRGNGLFRTD